VSAEADRSSGAESSDGPASGPTACGAGLSDIQCRRQEARPDATRRDATSQLSPRRPSRSVGRSSKSAANRSADHALPGRRRRLLLGLGWARIGSGVTRKQTRNNK